MTDRVISTEVAKMKRAARASKFHANVAKKAGEAGRTTQQRKALEKTRDAATASSNAASKVIAKGKKKRQSKALGKAIGDQQKAKAQDENTQTFLEFGRK